MQKHAELSSALKEQNFNKHIAEFRISILFQYFIYILANFNQIWGNRNRLQFLE